MTLSRRSVLVLAAWCCIALGAVKSQATTDTVTITPASCDFGTLTVPLKSQGCTFTVFNGTNQDTSVTDFSLTGSQFQLIYGLAPWPLQRQAGDFFTIVFAPTQAGAASGTLSVTVKGQSNPLTAQVTGTGATTTAVASLSTTAINFGNVAQGSISAPQVVTINNTGGQAFTIDTITVDPPFFAGPTSETTVQPGGSYSFDVYFNPSTPGNFTTTATLIYDSVPVQGIDLSGAGTATTPLAATTFEILPDVTTSAAYYAAMTAAGGTEPYTWSVQSGSTLPTGLTLTSAGILSGTLDPSVQTGQYFFTVQVQDAVGATSTDALTLNVDKPTGANCNNISWDVTGTQTLMEGLDVLGPNTYEGTKGGLYPGGSNKTPAAHLSYGIGLGQQIQPLDANGAADPNGKEVLLIVGESIVFLEGEYLAQDGNADPAKNPSVVVVNGGQGGATLGYLKDAQNAYWTTMLTYLLPNYGVTAEQVVAVWIEPVNGIHSGTFPSDVSQFQNNIEQVMQTLQILFPNIKIVYLSSRYYAGYSNGVVTDNPEPYAYETGFAVKWAIQDQLNGLKRLNYDPTKGPVLAPWMEWGPYYWSNGLVVPNTEGLVWPCEDLKYDGTHPNHASGKEKVANQVLNFLKADPTATPWFLTPAARSKTKPAQSEAH